MRNPPWSPSAESPASAILPGTNYRGTRDRALSHAEVERLCRDHHEALVRYLRARLHSTDEAAEVAQEAYVRLLHLDDPTALSFLKALLYRTAANLAIDRVRQRQRRRELDQEAIPQIAALSTTPAPERLWAARDELTMIEESLNELPPRCRQIFWLARIEDVSVEEIAEQMSMSVRSVWRYIARAMAHCHLRLDEAETAGRTGTDSASRPFPSRIDTERKRKPRR